MLSLGDYDYFLPEELIAAAPVEPRDASRLLVLDRQTGRLEHRRFRDLADYLDARDVLVANNTRVMKARLLGRRLLDDGSAGGKVEFLLLEQKGPRRWEGLFHASVKHRPGVRFEVPVGQGGESGVLRGEIVRGANESRQGTVEVEFDRDPVEMSAGEVPLPPYIHVARAGKPSWSGGAPDLQVDEERLYSTVYAKELGSAAAPTAGFHFTSTLLENLKARGVGWEEVTLHVGLGTFRPVKTEDIRQHDMHEERFVIAPEVAKRLNGAKTQGRRVVAVGTTSVRTLESAWREEQGVVAGEARTSLFLYPGKEFHVVDRLITNFHLPKSTLLMLVCAFAGRERVLEAYEEAVRERYRFFSYGDAMLIL